MMEQTKILVYGYGNPGREDDGLGVNIVSLLEAQGFNNVEFDSNYQLNVEDALAMSTKDVVIFVDASVDSREPFSFYKLMPQHELNFSSHAMSPQSVLALCNDLYGKNPNAYVLAIKGYSFDMIEKISTRAKQNLDSACSFLRDLLANFSLDKINKAVEDYRSFSSYGC